MATASRRITRKELRQPDWFQGATENAIEFYSTHQRLVIAAGAAVVVVLAIIFGWQAFKQSQDTEAAQEFTNALTLYQSEKYREAIPAFEKVKSYRWSKYSVLAHLYLAHSYIATKDLEKALSEAQRSLTATKPNTLYRQIAYFTLASVEEQKNQCPAAIEHYNEAQKIDGALQTNAALGKARCAEQTGDIKTAIAAYKEMVKDNPGSPYALKILELEAKAGQTPAGTAK